ncbi:MULTISPECIES: HAD family hydrolase [unclassified Sinorhizobium]|uniref:HAD family hydrolase n=1 Tax=unclassified Sinorhizobium TaxID=2613772 RepID=UPI0035251684
MLVIFDCDGVLIDSEVVYCAVDAEALTRLGHPTTAADIAKRFAGMAHRHAWATISEEIGFQPPDDWFEQLRLESVRRFETGLAIVPGADLALSEVAALGHQVCTASSTSLPSLTANLEKAGLLHLLQPHVYSVSQVRRPKPAPDVFLYAASQMGFDPDECIVIEDSFAGITAARRAGMRAIGFTGGGHAYDGLAERLCDAGAADLSNSMADVIELIRRAGS